MAQAVSRREDGRSAVSLHGGQGEDAAGHGAILSAGAYKEARDQKAHQEPYLQKIVRDASDREGSRPRDGELLGAASGREDDPPVLRGGEQGAVKGYPSGDHERDAQKKSMNEKSQP